MQSLFEAPKQVEVTTVLGDAVVGVSHLEESSKSPRTWPLFAIAGFFALLFALSFGDAVGVAAKNKEALHTWTQVEGRAPADFRPAPVSAAYDVVAMSSGLAALVCFAFGVLTLQRRRRRNSFDIEAGMHRGKRVAVVDKGQALVYPPAGVETRYLLEHGEGELQSLAMAGALRVPAQGQLRLDLSSDLHLFIREVVAPRQGLAMSPVFAGGLGRFAGVSLVGHLLLLLLLYQVPSEAASLDMDLLELERVIRIHQTTNEDKLLEAGNGDGEPGTGDNTATEVAMAGAEGLAGRPDSQVKSAKRAIAKVSEDRVMTIREAAVAYARQAGVLGHIKSSTFQRLVSQDPFTNGLEAQDFNGAQSGAFGDQYGKFGHSLRDLGGPGGGGKDIYAMGFRTTMGTCAMTDCDTGPGPGGFGTGGPTGDGMPKRKNKVPPKPRMGPVTCTNCMDKSIIRRLVRRKLSRIKNCYEQELVVNNELEGTVVVDFMVNTNGTVASARGKGMGNSAVESCVASAIKSIKFPSTPSMFSVSYPFTFRAP